VREQSISDLHFRVEEALNELEYGDIFSGERFKAKVLHSNKHFHAVQIDLDDGYVLRVHKLLATALDVDSG
jgi:hypothetical protein